MQKKCKNPCAFAIFEKQTIQKMHKHMGVCNFLASIFSKLAKNIVFLTFFEEMDAKKLQKPMCFYNF